MSRTPPTLLLVEDDSDLRDALVEILLGEGHTVAATGNGDEALSWLEAHPCPALLLVDMWTPRKDSWRLLDSLRREPRFADLPVMAISSSEERHPAIREVLSKPFDREALLAGVRRFVHPLH
ncbi:response regulator [Corallococcus sp. AB045]|uniref:response regulator n=1 Tax=unclassified Corallococcus TaxID=2685029 RepID=UPI000EDA9BD3|nr:MULTISPECIES: response regulator [unclassified Corallococcus]RKH82393.1 response regulator [Corallococcus sp. AB045]